MTIDLLLKMLKNSDIIEQIRKHLVRDISITIDGKEFQIIKKKSDEEELTQQLKDLKAEVWDLKRAIIKIDEVADTDIGPELKSAISRAKGLSE